jgi:hypothetical protein
MGQTVNYFIIRHVETVKSNLHKRYYFINHNKLEIRLKSDKNIWNFA